MTISFLLLELFCQTINSSRNCRSIDTDHNLNVTTHCLHCIVHSL